MIKKILIADDDTDDVDLFREALHEIDPFVEFHAAGNGLELIETLQSGMLWPDIIFLDINMPMMNGWECLEYLKKHKDFVEIPVIMYSTSTFDHYGENALKLGAIAVYEKPNNYFKLRDFIRSVINFSSLDLKPGLQHMKNSTSHIIYS